MPHDQTQVETSNVAGTDDTLMGFLRSSLATRQPAAFFNLLDRGANANNATGEYSLISFAMRRALRLNDSGADRDTINMHTGTALKLLQHGADLTHRPFDHDGRPAALHDPDLWRHPAFGACVLMHALDYAMAHDTPLPRLEIGTIDGRHGSRGGDRAADHILLAFGNVSRVQQQVASRLSSPGDEVEVRVAGRLPAGERDFWAHAARSFGMPVARLNL